MYILHFMYVYIQMRKNNKPVRSENLTLGQNFFFKEGLIWLVRGNTYILSGNDVFLFYS